MKEQTQSQSFAEITESQDRKNSQNKESKANKASKTRPIHKDKCSSNRDGQDKEEKSKLTKEERAKIQKEKNREAAQRSRDQHKEYVSNLEREIDFLKEELSRSRRFCHRCQQILDSSESELHNELNFSTVNDHSEHPIIEESLNLNQPAQQYSEPEYFLRELNSQEERNIFGMMFLVCFIVIGVMVGFNKEPQALSHRDLAQIYNPKQPNSLNNDLVINEKCIEQKGLVELHQGIEDQICLDSLMVVESPVLHKSLRSIHDHNYSEEMDSIMLCSLKTPKVYKIKPEIADSPVVRLFVSGSEIKQLASSKGPWTNLLDRNVQLNGIYKLAAQIKSIDLVTQHQCIL